jgi:hypothetical protein
VDVDANLRTPSGSHPDLRLWGDARGGDGGIREELAARVVLTRGSEVRGTRAEATRQPSGQASMLELLVRRSQGRILLHERRELVEVL